MQARLVDQSNLSSHILLQDAVEYIFRCELRYSTVTACYLILMLYLIGNVMVTGWVNVILFGLQCYIFLL